MRCSNDGIGSKSPLNLQFFSSTHVHQRKIAIAVHHQILRLEISIDNSIIVHMLYHQQNLSDQETSVLRRKGYHLCNHIKQILTLDELHHEVDEERILDQLVEAYYERMLGHCPQDLLLIHDVLDYLRFLHIGPIQHLNGVQLLRLVIPARIHLTKITLPQPSNYVKVSNLHLLLQRIPILLRPLLTTLQLLITALFTRRKYRKLHLHQHTILLSY